MPKRNSVSTTRVMTNVCLVAVSLSFGFAQIGCSNWGQSGINHEIFPLPIAQDDRTDDRMESGFYQPAPSIALATIESKQPDGLAGAIDSSCDHDWGCDCHRNKIEPKLPYAVPVDPPSNARLVPPSEIVNQPLAPIMYASTSNMVEVSDSRESNPSSIEVVTEASIEMSVALDSKPELLAPMRLPSEAAWPTEFSALSPLAPSESRFPQSDADWLKQSRKELAREIQVHAICDACQSESCDGTCRVHSRRADLTANEPVIPADFENSDLPLKPMVIEPMVVQSVTNETIEVQAALPQNSFPQDRAPHASELMFDVHSDILTPLSNSSVNQDAFSEEDELSSTFESSEQAINSVKPVSHQEDVFSSQQRDFDLPVIDDPSAMRPMETETPAEHLPEPEYLPEPEKELQSVKPEVDTFSESAVIEDVFEKIVEEAVEQRVELRLSNAVFCTEVSGFSQFKPFASDLFRPGQRMLIYCEVENQHSESELDERGERFTTRLQGSYLIYDFNGNVVEQIKYPVVEDRVRKRRRDFYLYFPIQLGNLPAGEYHLELVVEDLGGHHTASITAGLEFRME